MKKIKLFDPIVGKNEENAIKKILYKHNWASGMGGENVSKFEKNFSRYLDVDNCVTVNSGTAALHLALSLFDIKDKEVIYLHYLLHLLHMQFCTMVEFQCL